jgi:hypothetical protein
MLTISGWSPAVVAAMVPDDFVVLLLPIQKTSTGTPGIAGV